VSSLSGVRVGPLFSNGLFVKIRLTHELDALFEVNLGLPARRLVEVRVVGHGVANVAVEGTLDILGVDVGAERVVDHRDHLVERVGLLGADVVHAGDLVVGGELAGAGDVRDVGEVPRLAAVAEQLRGLAVRESRADEPGPARNEDALVLHLACHR